MKICVIGTGYVGLVVGACFSDVGNEVICVDVNRKKIANLKKGIIPIYEPGLEDIVKRNIRKGKLIFSTNIKEAVRSSLICFIAVGTPPGEDGSADLQHVLSVSKEISKEIDTYKVIVNKSTVPVGTALKVREIIEKEAKSDFSVVSNPEFLKEGTAVADFMRPHRIIIGTDSDKAEAIIRELYAPFNRTGKPILVMSNYSAELAKYAANAMLATRISFMNEMANFCEKVGANIDEVRQGLASDPRIGNKFLFAGVGYGGSCFPKDVKAIIRTAKQHFYDMEILRAVENVNLRQKTILLKKIKSHFEENLKGKHFAIWGLSFKPNTDDIREAPSLKIIESLLKEGVKLNVYDPVALKETKKVFAGKIRYSNKCYDVLKNADALVVVTEWNEFRFPDFAKMIDLMDSPVIFDGRNLYNNKTLKEHGFKAYYSIGREYLQC